MGKPPLKSTAALTKVKVKAELQARASWLKTKAGTEETLRNLVEKMVDKIDPLEAVACIGVTMTIYDLIKGTPELLVAVKADASQAWADLFTPLGWEKEIWSVITGATQTLTLTPEQQAAFEEQKNTLDPVLLLKSFGLAFILIRNNGAILNGLTSAGTGIASYVGGAFGMGIVA